MPAIVAEHLTKVFGRGETEVIALRDASVEVDAGELVALMGPSGSGKTTLLRAISLIDPPTEGRITIAGTPVYERERVLIDDRRLRREKMGIIFQAYNLIPFLTAAENVALVLTLNGVPDIADMMLRQVSQDQADGALEHALSKQSGVRFT